MTLDACSRAQGTAWPASALSLAIGTGLPGDHLRSATAGTAILLQRATSTAPTVTSEKTRIKGLIKLAIERVDHDRNPDGSAGPSGSGCRRTEGWHRGVCQPVRAAAPQFARNRLVRSGAVLASR